ncbi:hypothetical protein LIER_15662 [Lithospermum erythrorhizon]|uniref:Uncharacterized protein n=1 Tax=Lithospermum erythrorhizon TaxID=34254 RepID=A0AAV3Q675_LITER
MNARLVLKMVNFSESVDNLKIYLHITNDSFEKMASFVVHEALGKGIVPKRPEIGRGDFGGGCWTKKL